MYYSIRHLTKFLYSNAVSESMMETRMHPRSDQNQRCLTFHLSVSPRCRVFSYRDHLANQIHHFDIPGMHPQLVIVAESLVEVQPAQQIPAFLAPDAWADLDALVERGDYWEMLLPSEFAAPTQALDDLALELDVRRRDDPLMVLHRLNQQIYEYFDYKPKSTKVDSPIDLALSTKAGVCQDFVHLGLNLLRRHGIAARYVSWYLFTTGRDDDDDVDGSGGPLGSGGTGAAIESVEVDTHAWIEALMPRAEGEPGWISIDPTNRGLAGVNHVKIGHGRTYSDIPPVKGVYRGGANAELEATVTMTRTDGPDPASAGRA